MKYERTKELTKEIAESYSRFIGITGKQAYDQYGLKGDECIRESFYFDNGVEAEIKIVIPIDEDSYTWTEAILWSKDGKYLGCTEPCEDFLGEWHLEDHEGNSYTVNIKEMEI